MLCMAMGGCLSFSELGGICDPSRKKGAYPNFTLWLFHGHGREIVKNYWNVSEISLSRREKRS